MTATITIVIFAGLLYGLGLCVTVAGMPDQGLITLVASIAILAFGVYPRGEPWKRNEKERDEAVTGVSERTR